MNLTKEEVLNLRPIVNRNLVGRKFFGSGHKRYVTGIWAVPKEEILRAIFLEHQIQLEDNFTAFERFQWKTGDSFDLLVHCWINEDYTRENEDLLVDEFIKQEKLTMDDIIKNE